MTLNQLGREIKDLKGMVQDLAASTDLISEQEAAKLMGYSLATFRKKVYGKIFEGCYIINQAGRRIFFRSKVAGLKL